MYITAIKPRNGLQRPRFHFAGLKSFRPTVYRATMGIKYEVLVATTAVAVIAEKATVEPITASVIMMLRAHTK